MTKTRSENIRIMWEQMSVTNTLAYEHTELFTNVKMFMVQAPGLLAAGSTSKSR